MFKKSFQVVLIQITGIILGLLSVYFIAGDMSPEVYSLVGVFTVVNSIFLTFSDLGLETTMMREALYWKEKGEYEKVKEYTTQAFFSRFLGFCLLAPFLLLYLLYLNKYKYDGRYQLLMVTFLFGAWIQALNDSLSLVVRSTGGYVFSSFVRTANSYLMKTLGILLYFWKGSTIYLFFHALSSIPILLIFVLKLRSSFQIKYINIRSTLKKIYNARFLWLRTDLDYFRVNADSLLVSALFPASVMGSYTLYKNFENMVRLCIEGFFDVLTQSTVRYKGNSEELKKKEKQIKIARNLTMFALFLGIVVFLIAGDWIVRLVHLQQYDYIKEIVICAALGGIAYLIGKYEINALSLFASPGQNFKMAVIIFIMSVLSYGIVMLSSNIYGVLIQRVAILLANSSVAIVMFRKDKDDMYTNT